MNAKMKLLTAVIILTLISAGLFSIAGASGTKRALEAWFGVKVIYNNIELISNAQPFVVNGTTYVPLRMIMDNFGKDVLWDQNTYKISIYDRPNSGEAALRTTIALRDARITELENRVKELENRSSSVSLTRLESQLNDDYYRFESKYFYITLRGSSDSVTVKIEVSSSDWDNLSSTRRTDLLQRIVDDVRYYNRDADVSGYVKNRNGSSIFMDFSINSRGTVRTSTSTLSSLLYLEDTLNDDYKNYLGSNVPQISIDLSSSSSRITYYVYINLGSSESSWTESNVSTPTRTALMRNIYNKIKDRYGSSYDIEGYIYNSYNNRKVATYYQTSGGYDNYTGHPR